MNTTSLKKFRISQNITQVALAERCRCDQAIISKIERQVTPPTLEMQFKLAYAFNMGLNELQRACDWPVTVIPQSTSKVG